MLNNYYWLVVFLLLMLPSLLEFSNFMSICCNTGHGRVYLSVALLSVFRQHNTNQSATVVTRGHESYCDCLKLAALSFLYALVSVIHPYRLIRLNFWLWVSYNLHTDSHQNPWISMSKNWYEIINELVRVKLPPFTTCTNPIIHLFNPPKICIGIVFDFP